MTVRLRFAPSPTGYLHIGSVWTALFTWMYARHHDGRFILRIEDTDVKRTVPGAVDYIMEGLRWFGIDWDEGPDVGGPVGPYVQTERRALYNKWAHWLVDQGLAYKCFATEEELEAMRQEMTSRGDRSGYDRRYRDAPPSEVAALEAASKPYAIRFRMPLEGATIMPDLLRGDVVFENSQITDYVLLKSNGLPTYHLAHVVDDHFMRITHITRGVEWLSTAPLHVQLWRAFGWDMPTYIHFPVILSPDGQGKLSKRRRVFLESGEPVMVMADEFRQAGFLPEAMRNFLATVGWSFGNDIEKFTTEEAIARFELADLSPSPTMLPYSKLEWLNGQYIQEMSPEELASAISPFLDAAGFDVEQGDLLPLMPVLSVRLKRLNDAVELVRFLYEDPAAPPLGDELTHRHLDAQAAQAAFAEARERLAGLPAFTVDAVRAALTEVGARHTANGKAGPFLGRARLAITRQPVSPPLFESAVALGRDRTLRRLDEAIAALQS